MLEAMGNRPVQTVLRPPATDNKAITAYWLTYLWLAQRIYLGELTPEGLLENIAVKRTGAQRKFDVLFSHGFPPNSEGELSLSQLASLSRHIEDAVALRQDSYDAMQRELAKAA